MSAYEKLQECPIRATMTYTLTNNFCSAFEFGKQQTVGQQLLLYYRAQIIRCGDHAYYCYVSLLILTEYRSTI